MCSRRPVAVLLLAGLLALIPTLARASGDHDLRGNWRTTYTPDGGSECCVAWFRVTAYDASSGAYSGTGSSTEDGDATFTFSGTETGSAIDMTYQYPGGYNGHYTGTVAADGASWSGEASDSNNGHGTFQGTRAGGDPSPTPTPTATPTPQASPTPTPSPAGAKRPTGTWILCNFKTLEQHFECTAQVGDGGPQPPVRPTGTVKWSATSGGFAFGDSCTLQPGSGNTSFCVVTWNPPAGGVPTGTAPPIKATYGGDASHDGSSASAERVEQGISSEPLPSTCFFESGCLGTSLRITTRLPATTKTLPPVQASCGAAKAAIAQVAPGVAGAVCRVAGGVSAASNVFQLGKAIGAALQDIDPNALPPRFEQFEERVDSLPPAEALQEVQAGVSFLKGVAPDSAKVKAVSAAVGKLLGPALAPLAAPPAPGLAGGSRKRAPVLAVARLNLRRGAHGTLRMKVLARQRPLLATLKAAGFSTVQLRYTVSVGRRGSRMVKRSTKVVTVPLR